MVGGGVVIGVVNISALQSESANPTRFLSVCMYLNIYANVRVSVCVCMCACVYVCMYMYLSMSI